MCFWDPSSESPVAGPTEFRLQAIEEAIHRHGLYSEDRGWQVVDSISKMRIPAQATEYEVHARRSEDVVIDDRLALDTDAAKHERRQNPVRSLPAWQWKTSG